MINRLEIMRKQIEDLVKSDSTAADLKAALKDFDKKAMDVELKLLTRSDLHSDDKWYVEQYKVYLNLLWLVRRSRHRRQRRGRRRGIPAHGRVDGRAGGDRARPRRGEGGVRDA